MKQIVITLLILISLNVFSQTTPTVQSTNITFSNVSYNVFTTTCTNGNGSNRIFFIKATTTGRSAPVNNTTYIANPVYKSGTQIGASGWYCVYKGTGNSVTVTGLSVNTTYRIHVCEFNGNPGTEKYLKNTSTKNPLNQLTDNYSIWNGIVWSAGIPNATTYAVINGNYSGASLITKQLIINSPYTLTLNGGINLTTNGKVTINGKLIIVGTSSSNGSFINNDSVIGNITIQKYLVPNEWHLISSPVKNYPIDSIKQYYLMLYDEPLDKFTRSWLTTGIITADGGYASWAYNPATLSFKGSVNYQSSINLTKLNKGYNLIGNPYLSCIDWESTYWNRTNISNTIWIWSGTQYATYTKGIGGTNGGTRYIPAVQGFFVQSTLNNASFVLDSRTRVHNTTLLKSAIIDTPYSKMIVINANDGFYNDQCIIAYRDSALNDSDYYDATKLMGTVIQSYSINNKRKLAVNVLKDKDSIAFAIKPSYENQTVTISFNNFTNDSVFLYDKNKLVRKDISYKTNISLNDSDRFYIKLIPIDTTPKDTIKIPMSLYKILNDVNVYSINKNIYINGTNEYTFIEVFNINGSCIYSAYSFSDKYAIENIKPGFYVVRIIKNNELTTKRIIVY